MLTKSGLRSMLALVIGTTLTATACSVDLGGEDEAQSIGSSDTTETTIGSTTTSAETESTVQAAQDDSGVIAPIAESLPSNPQEAEMEDGEAEFCEASADYWIASVAFSYVDQDRPAEVSTVFKLIEARLEDAIAAAPTEELAAPAIFAQEHFDLIHDGISDASYDLDVFEASSVYTDLQPAFTALSQTDDLLEAYITGPCGYSPEPLQAAADSTASDIARLVDGILADENNAADEDNAADYSGDYIEIVDTTDRLKVHVPIDWEDVQSEPSGSGAALTIAPDVNAYLTAWSADGLKMTVSDASGPADWRQPMYETNASSECVLVSSEPYSDSLYTGWIDRYDSCAGGPATAVVLGATDEDFSVEILVEIQFDNVDTQNDEGTVNQILNTFKAR